MNKVTWGTTLITMVSFLTLGSVIAGCSPKPDLPSDSGQTTTQLTIDLAGKRYEFLLDQYGKLESKVEASSADGIISLYLEKGATVLDMEDSPLQKLQAVIEPNPPTPPENTDIIGPVYSFRPPGATFDPWLTLTLSYDPEKLPPGLKENDLYLDCHDGTRWQQLRYRKVDTKSHSVTTQIYNFSTCAILGPKKPASSGSPAPSIGTGVGDLAPDFQLQSLDGQTLSLGSLRGKPVLLNFWATWCSPCVFEMPLLQEIYEEYSEKGLVMAAVDIGESPSKVEGFLQSRGLSLPVLMDSKAKVAGKYNIAAIPTTFFIDKDGIIRDKKIGAFTRKAEIEKGLNRINL